MTKELTFHPPECKIKTAVEGSGSLVEKIKTCITFLIYADTDFVQGLKRRNPYLDEVRLAKKFNKPVILVIDSCLSKEDTIFLERLVAGMKIEKEITFDFSDPIAKEKAERETREIMIEVEKRNEAKKNHDAGKESE